MERKESKERKEKLHETPDTGEYEAPSVSPMSGETVSGTLARINTNVINNIVHHVASRLIARTTRTVVMPQ